MSIGTTIAKLLRSERNLPYQTYRAVERKVQSGDPDPQWLGKNADAFIDLHEDEIPTDQRWRFNLTHNQVEAELLLADMQAQERDAYTRTLRGVYGGNTELRPLRDGM